MAQCVQGQDGKFSNSNKEIRDTATELVARIKTSTNLTGKASGILTAGKKSVVRLDNQGEIEVTVDKPHKTSEDDPIPLGRYYNLQLQVGTESIAGIFLDISLSMDDNLVLNIKNAFTRSLADKHFYWVLPS